MSTFDMMSKRVTAEELGDSLPTHVAIYYALQVSSGHILLPILLAIFYFSPKINRHPALLNLIIAFIFSSISACLLLYNGTHIGPQPSRTLCVLQAGFINGITPMWSVASLVFVYNIWNTFIRATKKQSGPDTAVKRVAMLAAPYISWLIWTIASLCVAFKHADTVNRDRRVFYCSVDYQPFTGAMSAFASVVCLVITGFQIHLGAILYQNYRKVGMEGTIDVKFLVRTLLFGVYTLVGIFVSLSSVFYPSNSYSDIFAATFGMAVFLIFGTQADVFRAVNFLGKRHTDSTPSIPWTPAALPTQHISGGGIDEKFGQQTDFKKVSLV